MAAVSMNCTPRSIARRTSCGAASPAPITRIAPKPRRETSWSPITIEAGLVAVFTSYNVGLYGAVRPHRPGGRRHRIEPGHRAGDRRAHGRARRAGGVLESHAR